MADAVKITAPDRYLRVLRADGTLLDRNLTVEDAIESAVNAGPGDYRITYPDRLVKVYGVLPPASAPTVPTALTLEDATGGYVSLSWTDDGTGTSWTVYRDGAQLGAIAVQAYTDSTVVPSTPYSYQVQASNSTGSSALSDVLAVETSSNSVPEWGMTDQSGSIGTEFFLDLSSACTDIDDHAIAFALTNGSVPGLSLAGFVYSGTPTTAGAYPLTFRASDGYGTADVAITFTVADSDVTAPSVPTGVSSSANGSTVTVSWTASTDATGVATYKVYRDGVFRASNTASPYVESGVPDGSYVYTVSAVDSSANANESAQSVAAPVTVAPSTPDVPINFTATSDGATTIHLSWVAGPNSATPDDYDLAFSATSAAGPWTAITFTGTATTYAHTGRTVGVTYYYRVRAGLGTAESGYAITSATAGARNVYFVSSFESGQMLDRATSPLLDSCHHQCATEPYGAGGLGSVRTSGAGHGPTSALDVRVVSSDTEPTVAGVAGVSVVSRTGPTGKFLRGLITPLKDYRDDQDPTVYQPGDFKFGKPRWTFTYGGGTGWKVTDPNYKYAADGSGWAVDKTVWLGFSMYIPSNYQPDRGMKYEGQRENNPFDILCNNGSASNSFVSFRETLADPRLTSPCLMKAVYHVCDWSVSDDKNPDGTDNPHATDIEVPLFEMTSMRGKWVDFIIRFRENPFSVTRNPATGVGGPIISRAMNHTFAANTGVLQMWWGEAGTVFNPTVPTTTYESYTDLQGVTRNSINFNGAPMGLVPLASNGRNFSVRQYKANWLKNLGSPAGPALPNNPDPAKRGVWAAHAPTPTHTPPASTCTDPMYKAFDEIRWGYEAMGTGLNDVKPG